MEFTGERYLPTESGQVRYEHLHRYAICQQFVRGKSVLDIASGEGYGSAILAKVATSVVGVDIGAQTIKHASEKYAKSENLSFIRGSVTEIPLTDASIDVVVSFETIEHLEDHEAMLCEIRRVLKPNGVFIISSPDKRTYSDIPQYSNPYHVHELYLEQFESLLGKHFKNVSLYGQRLLTGSLMSPLVAASDAPVYEAWSLNAAGTIDQRVAVPADPVYLVAVCSNVTQPQIASSLYADTEDDLYAAHMKVHQWIRDLDATLQSVIEDRDAQLAGVAQLKAAYQDLSSERDGQVAALNASLQSVIEDRDAQLAGVAQLKAAYQELSSERDGQLAALNASLQSVIEDRDAQLAGVAQLKAAYQNLSSERDGQLAALNASLQSVIEDRDAQIENLRMELSAIYRSKSWRLTSPLRRLVRGASKIIGYVSQGDRRHARPSTFTPIREIAEVGEISKEATAEHGVRKFRILLVSYYCPTRAHAGGLRILDIYSLIRQQCPHVQLDLLTHHRPAIDWSLDDVHRIFHNVYLSPVEELTPVGLATLRSSPLAYDVVDLQFHQTGSQMDAFRRIGGKIIFTPMESLTKVLFYDLRTKFQSHYSLRLIKTAASIRAAAEEIGFTQKADEVVCVSRADAAFLRAITSSRHICGVNTGVSQFEFAEALAPGFTTTSAAGRRCCVLYVAYFGSETNVVALRWYLDHVHPLVKASVPDYVLTVVGRGDLSTFSKYQDGSIEFIGEVPAIAPHIKKARVAIAPALGGSGFRGKVNQYAVLGVPCVVSPIAFKGLAYKDGVNVFIAETPELFADRCVRLLTDLELNDRMGRAARQLCMERYSWQSKWPAIRRIYKLEEIE